MNPFSTSAWILVNGLFRSVDEPAVKAGSRGLMYGDGCFETMIYTGYGIAGIEPHLKRMQNGLEYLSMRVPDITGKEKFIHELRLLIQKNKLHGKPARIRLQVFRDNGVGYATSGDENVCWILQAKPLDQESKSIRLGLSDVRRIPSNAINPAYKLTNGINYIVAANNVKSRKWDDGIMLDQKGNVSETTCANLIWEKEGEWFTPSESCDILPGITRKFVIQWLKENDVKVFEGEFLPNDIKNADALFVMNSVRLLQPVSQFEDKMFLGGSNHAKAFATWLNDYIEEV